MKPSCIGVTGLVGSGKSTVTSLLSDITGFFPVSLDSIGHEAYLDKSIRNAVIDHFSSVVLDAEGNINRKMVGSIVFDSEMEKKWLDSIVWPYIIQRTKKIVLKHQKCILDGVILFPSGLDALCKVVVIVQSNKKILKERNKKQFYSDKIISKLMNLQLDMINHFNKGTHTYMVKNNHSISDLANVLSSFWKNDWCSFFEMDSTTETIGSRDI